LVLLAGCASAPLVVDGGDIRTLTGQTLHEVRAIFHPTGRLVFVKTILPDTEFDLSFPPTEATSEYVDLTWRQGRDEMSARIDTPRHQPSGATGPVRLHYAIHRDGTATVEVVARR
jgi:hypothetical protein